MSLPLKWSTVLVWLNPLQGSDPCRLSPVLSAHEVNRQIGRPVWKLQAWPGSQYPLWVTNGRFIGSQNESGCWVTPDMPVLHRHKDIQYSSRVADHIMRQKQTHRLRHVIKQLA